MGSDIRYDRGYEADLDKANARIKVLAGRVTDLEEKVAGLRGLDIVNEELLAKSARAERATAEQLNCRDTDVAERDAEIAALEQERDAMERRFREALWLRHGCSVAGALYGDDGEMQCNACMIDFKRLPLEEIEQRLMVATHRRLAGEGDKRG